MKFIKKNKIIMIILLVILIIGIGMYPVLSKKGVIRVTKNDSNALKIYVFKGQPSPLFATCISNFKKMYPQIKIEEIPFSSDGDEYFKTLLSDTLAGDGPDVIYFEPEQLNVHKLQKAQMLEDLNPFIEKDKDFDGENYNKNILNTGLYNGEMTFIPLDYYVNSYITTTKVLKDNSIELKNNITQNEFISSINKSMKSISANGSKTLFAYPISITDWIESSGIDYIDYENKKISIHSNEFKKVIDNYKIVYKDSPKQVDITGTSGDEGYNAIKSGSSIFSNDKLSLGFDMELLQSESKIKSVVGEEQVIDSIPTYNGGDKVTAMAGESMAISKNCKNKAMAYNFIKIALTSKMTGTSDYDGFVPLMNVPTNKKTREDLVNYYLEKQVGKSIQINKRGEHVTMEKPSKQFQIYYNKITENIETAKVKDITLDSLMMQCLTPYLEDKEPYDSTLKSLESKINLYLNE